jgi:uncharacterized protein (TIGR02001 family)
MAVMLSAWVARAQDEQDPVGERLETADEVRAEKAASEEAETKSWLPGGLSGNVAVYSDYSFRGVSQTQRDMALQGGIDYNHESGLFAGLWGSSVDFGDAYLEMDYYGGYEGAIDAFSYKAVATFFYYPDAGAFNDWEFAGLFGYDFGFLSTSAGLIGSPDYFGGLGTGFYVPMGFAVPLPTIHCPWTDGENCFEPSFDANGGYTHTEEVIFPNSHHYFDWNAGLVLAMPFNLSLDFRYVDTDVDDVHDAGARFVFGAKYAF